MQDVNIYGNMVSIDNNKYKRNENLSNSDLPKFLNTVHSKLKVARTQVQLYNSSEKLGIKSIFNGGKAQDKKKVSSNLNSYINRRSTVNNSNFEAKERGAASQEGRLTKGWVNIPVVVFGKTTYKYTFRTRNLLRANHKDIKKCKFY